MRRLLICNEIMKKKAAKKSKKKDFVCWERLDTLLTSKRDYSLVEIVPIQAHKEPAIIGRENTKWFSWLLFWFHFYECLSLSRFSIISLCFSSIRSSSYLKDGTGCFCLDSRMFFAEFIRFCLFNTWLNPRLLLPLGEESAFIGE